MPTVVESVREMTTKVNSVMKAIREKGIRSVVREAREEGYLTYLKYLDDDGNLLPTNNMWSKFVGVDKVGNKYYENMDLQHGRHRWVEYGGKGRYYAPQVPPEWHGWLHYITDHTGEKANPALGFSVDDGCRKKFLDFKARRTHRFIVFKVEEKQ